MKISLIAGAIALSLGTGVTQASSHLWNFSGTVDWYDAVGVLAMTQTTVVGRFDFSGMDPTVPGLGALTTNHSTAGNH
ncbi:MAG: hypothetical protein OEY67_00525 [Gammaproteobacteria bacterium]|nr:hypothetical protein [Gammaproteobacteria bacterium]